MLNFLLRAVIAAVGLWVASLIVPGVHVRGPGTLLAAAVLLGVINAVVKPALIVLTLPLTVLTLGLFLLVINALSFWLVGVLLPGFHVAGFWPALWGALVVGLTSWAASGLSERRVASLPGGLRRG